MISSKCKSELPPLGYLTKMSAHLGTMQAAAGSVDAKSAIRGKLTKTENSPI